MKRAISVYCQEKGYNPELGGDWPVGDDARPYVGAHLISVADGAGGRGGRRCSHIAEGLCDPERSFDIMTAGCFAVDGERYRGQYDENFVELYDLGDEAYARSGGRHSAYFGARLTSIFMRAILEEEFPEDELYERFVTLSALQGAERERSLRALEKRLAQRLSDMLKRAERNGHLDDAAGAALNNTNALCTTYSGILFFEDEKSVTMLSIQAGDSMLWGLASLEGDVPGQQRYALRQLQSVQENESGGMSNYISTDAPFYLRCALHRLEKPCGALVATDGCFDAFSQLSQFEFRLMYALMQAEDLADAERMLADFYDSFTYGDDSASMALRFFGEEDAIPRMANRRRAELEKLYEPENDKLYQLDEDAAGDAERAVLTTLRGFQEEFWTASPTLRREACQQAQQTYAQAVETAVQQAQRSLLEPQRALEEARKNGRAQVERLWLSLRRAYVPGAEKDNIYEEQRQLKEARAQMAVWPQKMRQLLEELTSHIEANAGTEPFDEATRERLGNLAEQITSDGEQLRGLLEDYEDQDARLQDRARKLRREQNRRLVDEKELVDRCVQHFSAHPEEIERLSVLGSESRGTLTAAFRESSACEARLAEARARVEQAREEYGQRLYRARPAAYLADWRRKYAQDLPAELKERVEAALAPVERERDEIAGLTQRREALSEAYRRETQQLM